MFSAFLFSFESLLKTIDFVLKGHFFLFGLFLNLYFFLKISLPFHLQQIVLFLKALDLLFQTVFYLFSLTDVLFQLQNKIVRGRLALIQKTLTVWFVSLGNWHRCCLFKFPFSTVVYIYVHVFYVAGKYLAASCFWSRFFISFTASAICGRIKIGWTTKDG